MATATDDEQDHVGVHYSGPHAGCLTHEADLKAKLAAAEARCAELERSLAICAKGFDGLAATMKAQKSRADRCEAALLDLETRLSGLLDRLTCGLFSKPGYSVDQMESFIDEAYQKRFEEEEAEAHVRCMTLQTSLASEKARAARYEAALREIVHYGWYAKAARVARAALAEVK